MLSKRMKEILNDKKITLEFFSQMSGVPMETLRNIYYGRTSNPNIKTIMAIAEALDMTINDFLGVESSTNKDEKILLNYFRRCGRHGKSIILNMAKIEADSYKEKISHYKIPCISAVDNVFHNHLYDINNVLRIETDNKEAYLAFKTNVNDAAPTYCKGDIILLANRFPDKGEHALFLKDGKAFLSIFHEEKDGYRLKRIHEIGEEYFMRRLEDVECLGTLCGIIKC